MNKDVKLSLCKIPIPLTSLLFIKNIYFLKTIALSDSPDK